MFLVLGTICPTTCQCTWALCVTVGINNMAAHRIVVARWWGFC
jgi:hypothetical protein